MSQPVRVRFAPSPTGGLHLGGVRTALYNYLFARQHQGTFIVRIEDTDQNRFVPGAEQYLFDCLKWCGIEPDESAVHGGTYGPYRQSERKALYKTYAEQLVKEGYAYRAFDTVEELDQMRETYKTPQHPSPQYDHTLRLRMRNSMSLSPEQTQQLLEAGTPYVIRIKMPEKEQVTFTDMIRGEVRFDTGTVDDKVLLKADGMPTYHLAVVVDDHLMKISHAFRGEEWLPSTPVHLLLWKYLFGLNKMPKWAHLPLILGPSGKLSKRDGAKYGFPVFAMNWTDPVTRETVEGFKEKGFLPEGFLNFLALLGWNDGTERELYSLKELVEAFSLERVHSSGAKFDYEKAKWFNQEWIKRTTTPVLMPLVQQLLQKEGIQVPDISLLETVIDKVKERCHLLSDFVPQTVYFFKDPAAYDLASIQPKWSKEKALFFVELISEFSQLKDWNADALENCFKEVAGRKNLKPGDLQLPLRIMLVGGKFGPPVFDIAALLGLESTRSRIQSVLKQL